MTDGLRELFVTAAAGTADLLAIELASFGAVELKESRGGVAARGSLETAYRACLWSRVGLRVLMPVAHFPAPTPEALYAGAREIDWSRWLRPDGTLAVDFTTTRSAITHTQYGAQKTKDAVCDQFREKHGIRPSVDTAAPDLRINVHLDRDQATVSIDLAGESLHRRGYRARQVAAPLKENLAAAILLRAGWPAIAAAGGGFLDPMCGSGTLVIEAALIAGDVAPGLLRARHGFERWPGHDAGLWQRLKIEADQRRARGKVAAGRIRGYDRDSLAVRVALENAERAGLKGIVHFERREVTDLVEPNLPTGLVAVNPPYGERIGEIEALEGLYAALGTGLRDKYQGWEAAVFVANPELGKALGISARRIHPMWNGPIECRLLRITVSEASVLGRREPGRMPKFDAVAARERPGSKMFANRLAKNLKALSSWAKREQVSCFRLYDADMPEYAFAIDLYQADPAGSGGRWLYVQEYAPPATVDPARARVRREEALAQLAEVTGVPEKDIYLRTRRQQKGTAQYEKLDQVGEFVAVDEGGLKLLVNFTDYLDTGLFLDHRITRKRLGELARGRRFLNLFSYTGTATVHAAAGGASGSLSVDMSRTYLDWARRNLALNGFDDGRHGLLQADCVEWLARDDGQRFGLVFLDPPSFSNSKRMQGEFDVQRDHVRLVRQALGRLDPGGLLVFSNNLQRFKLDREALADLTVEDWTASTLPRDFERHARIHQVFAIRAKS
ncbi:MAG: bifunctional 23S rRNA (guanine(2069)-N(7))-methyltransferase RlmK/23S rRNA (guanine(2445)-N(2))-methyltransferase RlmL [Gammaproteobacteria bacterium]|mgnify:CR=1 FL=1|nr:bifunctional 23S rRNA (guanine(2069)-N(7))-methyltransferase RlmK/23S rRNA (guanine(2445)-N(2))-methyltransferase RlmL [Gammaproteobacteria bacterium]